jgi:hypothetical protein
MSNDGKISDEQLLKMAMGVKLDDEEAQATVDVMKLKSEWEIIPERGRDILTKRKKMRHNMFKIVKRLTRELEMTPETTPELLAIKAIIDPQIEAHPDTQVNWFSFTFLWDLHPRDHTKIIAKGEWFAAGGRFDELGALMPTAFTEQQID